jgi:hypothetical protein
VKKETRNSEPVTSGSASIHPVSDAYSCIVVAQGHEGLVQKQILSACQDKDRKHLTNTIDYIFNRLNGLNRPNLKEVRRLHPDKRLLTGRPRLTVDEL